MTWLGMPCNRVDSRIVAVPGVHDPHRRVWLSAHRTDTGLACPLS